MKVEPKIGWNGKFSDSIEPLAKKAVEDYTEWFKEGDKWKSLKKTWEEQNPEEKGMKFSFGKPKWQLMSPLWPAMEQVVRVLTRGAEKYEPNNWMHVDKEEYLRAIMSHFTAYATGETIDTDMGSPHLANLICSALFLMWHDGIKAESNG